MLKKLFAIFLVGLFSNHFLNLQAKEEDSYVLLKGAEAENRLNVQHDLYKGILSESFQWALGALKVKGPKVIDFGCGTASAYEDIKNIIGDSGKYIGIDASHEQIIWCKGKYPNTEFIVGNEEDESTLEILTSADIIYMRFVVMHQKKPAEFLTKVFNAMKPKSMMIIQEPEATQERRNLVLEKYPYAVDLCDIKAKLGAKTGLDYNFAGKIVDHLKSLKYQIMQHAEEDIEVPMPKAKGFLATTIMEIHKKDSSLISSQELENYLGIISKLPDSENENWILDRMHIIAVQKK